MPTSAPATRSASTRARRAKARAARMGFLLGLAATALTVALWAAGALTLPEGFLLDLRAIHATRTAPPITDRIVHLDIDQRSLEAEGRWAWDREKLALVIDALTEARAKAIVLDLLMSEAQSPRLRRSATGVEDVRDDDLLAAAFARAGNVIQGVNIAAEDDAASPTDGNDEVQRPIGALESAAAALGFVNVREPGARAVRTVPAVESIRGEHLVQLGVAAAAFAQGVPLAEVRVENDTLILGDLRLPVRDGRILVPWHVRRESRDGPAPWVRGAAARWLPIHPHYSMYLLVQYARSMQQAVAILTDNPDRTGPVSDAELAEARGNAEFFLSPFQGRDLGEVADELRAEAETAEEAGARAEAEQSLAIVEAARALERCAAIRSDAGVGGELGGEPFSLAMFRDKVVFIGWNASGAVADFYPTAMDVRTPGVTVHAAVASGILSGHWKVPAPMWADGLAILALGLGATIIAIRLPVGTGAIAVAVLALAYSAVNAFVVFDRGNIALHAAGPLVALTTAWAACTAMRAIQEAREKGAIRRQFRSRVSSQLVDYLAENPDLMNMEGEEREVTTMFTDFVGFTSISESLEGKATVKLLNVYLGEIAEALMQEGAYVNKFLGDGIMAFWGAPVDQPDHAARACRAAIAAVATLERVNNLPEYKDLPKLGMRLGISTGKAIVGDCGAPPKLNDYTVIGDPINLAARLESANKLVGTRILVTARTRELIPPDERNALAWRPMGLLRVVGQQKPQEIWELLGPRSWVDEDPELREWIDKTTKAVELFRAGDYAGALPLWQDLVLFERGQAGALLYVERCAELIDSGEVNPALPLRSK